MAEGVAAQGRRGGEYTSLRLAPGLSGNMGGMAPDQFDGNSPLTPEEQLDSDEIRNDDGDEVVDPPDRWLAPKEDETLDERLSDEVPDIAPEDSEQPPTEAHDSDAGGGLELVSDHELDGLDTQRHGHERGQIDGTPEDGASFFDVEK